ncbi:acid-sensing ion channel 5-like [Mya arenaria]|nr:acid-sensing ion channel 5-like [Mya arenaria]
MPGKEALSEYMDYATVHGVGRLKNSPFKVLKLIWIFALTASFGMISWQVIELYIKYSEQPISTSREIKTPKVTKFPLITICNTNPLQYFSFPGDSYLELVIKEMSSKYEINPDMFNGTEDFYEYNYTAFDSSNTSSIDNDVLFYSAEKFKTKMALLDFETLIEYSQPMNEFILICNFAGSKCTENAWDIKRSFDYGLCYEFYPDYQMCTDPMIQSGCGNVASAGQQYGLEMLLNVDQEQSIPFVTSSTGVLVIPSHEYHDHVETNQGIFVPTGFEANVALRKTSTHRVPGKNVERLRCNASAEVSYEECLKDYQDIHILEVCGCLHHFYETGMLNASIPPEKLVDPNTGDIPCFTDAHQNCVRETLAQFVLKTPESFDNCLPSCEKDSIDKRLMLLNWPNEFFTPILRRIVKSKLPQYDLESLNRDKIRDNMLLLRVYLDTLSYEHVKEEYSYGIVNFVSDIGGQLGLWAGFSILSVLEVIELVLLVFALRKRQNETREREATSVTQVQPIENNTDASVKDKPYF